ncbi:MAG: hypothetical protein ACRBG0_27790 [Lewinella sp.]|uniref:hypothetical protein n=1 Tax=Lewinella sp. TaxID=2004506 RepID=UPI003D6A5C4E
MGFFSNVVSGTVKLAITPVAAARDVVNVAQGKEADAVKSTIQSSMDDFGEAMEDMQGLR